MFYLIITPTGTTGTTKEDTVWVKTLKIIQTDIVEVVG